MTTQTTPQPTTQGRTVTTDRLPEARLLVVDDEPNILELLATSLRFAGFEVATATNGRDALAEARRLRPDLVVLDVMMPDMDGFAVVRRMRGEGTTAPVLFLTARDATEDKVTGLTVGGDERPGCNGPLHGVLLVLLPSVRPLPVTRL